MEAVHAALASCASRIGGTDSKQVGAFSRHVLPPRASFANLTQLHDTLKRSASEAGLDKPRDFVATSGRKLVYSARLEPAPSSAPSSAPPKASSGGSRKRRREDEAFEAVESTVETARKKARGVDGIADTDVDAAEAVLTRSQQALRGPSGERILQSHALVVRKLRDADASPRLVIALRCMPSVPIPITALRAVMGGFWADGAVEICVAGDDDVFETLPRTDAGRVAESHGHASLMVVTSAVRE